MEYWLIFKWLSSLDHVQSIFHYFEDPYSIFKILERDCYASLLKIWIYGWIKVHNLRTLQDLPIFMYPLYSDFLFNCWHYVGENRRSSLFLNHESIRIVRTSTLHILFQLLFHSDYNDISWIWGCVPLHSFRETDCYLHLNQWQLCDVPHRRCPLRLPFFWLSAGTSLLQPHFLPTCRPFHPLSFQTQQNEVRHGDKIHDSQQSWLLSLLKFSQPIPEAQTQSLSIPILIKAMRHPQTPPNHNARVP